MNYGRYSRSVMILSEQGREFAAGDGRVTGYLKVETGNNKGAIRCSVENLRPWPKGDYIYKLILFGSRGERMIHSIIGTVAVGRSGNGEAYFRFNPLDVDGKGNDYSRFTAAVVAAVSMKDEQEPLHPVLKGSTGNEQEEPRPLAASAGASTHPSTNALADTPAGAPLGEQIERAASLAMGMAGGQAAESGTGKEEAGAEEPEPEQEPEPRPGEISFEPDPGKDMAEGRMNRTETAARPTAREASSSKAPESSSGAKKSGTRCYNNFYNDYILHSCSHTCQVAEYYEEVKPFVRDFTGARWKKIMNIMNLPLVSPGAHYFASLYHHYLFGARPDARGYASCYFFGIPGRRMEAEQPDGGRSGFVYWQPMKGTEGQKNPYGYWIVEIDGQTGDIRDVTIEKDWKM